MCAERSAACERAHGHLSMHQKHVLNCYCLCLLFLSSHSLPLLVNMHRHMRRAACSVRDALWFSINFCFNPISLPSFGLLCELADGLTTNFGPFSPRRRFLSFCVLPECSPVRCASKRRWRETKKGKCALIRSQPKRLHEPFIRILRDIWSCTYPFSWKQRKSINVWIEGGTTQGKTNRKKNSIWIFLQRNQINIEKGRAEHMGKRWVHRILQWLQSCRICLHFISEEIKLWKRACLVICEQEFDAKHHVPGIHISPSIRIKS